MGVPKFFRWISERYPCLSELVKEHQIPDFDNLYLDMNGIIHTCSHPNDHDPHFRITEEKICKDVFHYIEILFHMIKPQKLFFMAVDGVAPRAKQNQQRGRRFRTAKDAEMTEKKAKDKGEALPDTARFDSNCITPGTVFMTNLQEELKLYVAKKISTDSDWKKCTIILSGHETPGEGEHKIMDYIRYMKAQPDYDPNTRHCLYGLDADLIMLGLCSHEPHFALLREEVKFGRGNHDKRISTPEETTFYLLHLSLMREYLDMEFTALKEKLPFPFDLECIIDDWVLMGFLVGNDFIPPLPDMHINEGALPILYKVYMEVLPTLDGYLNEQGTLNLPRFQTYMQKLAEFDINQFRDNSANLMYFQAKTGRAPSNGRARYSHKINSKQIELIPDGDEPDSKPKSQELTKLIQYTNDIFLDSSDEEDFDYRCFDDTDPDSAESIMMMEFRQHKNNYYVNKLEYDQVTPEVMREQAECYVRAIQWILNYYYNGVCSWSWFYPHHYAPYISDVKDFASLKLEYDMGRPFLPFQQLLAVLPSASKELLPLAFQHLMVADDSPIIDYYPLEFSTDMNGKKQEWEALVLIPFIDEAVLLSAMEACYDQMTPEERKRNTHGPMCVFSYSPDDLGVYPKTLYNPSFAPNHANLLKVNREEIFVEKTKLVKGLCPNINLITFIPGFPTFKHIPYSCYYNKKQVKVFESPSRGENAIVRITPREPQDIGDLAARLLGTNIYVCWPHLVEAKVVSVSNPEVAYTLDEVPGGGFAPAAHPMPAPDVKTWHQERASIAEVNLKRRGIDVGDTSVLVRARLCIGRVYEFKPEGDVELVKQWAEVPTNFVLQATVAKLPVYDRTVVKFATMSDVFRVGTKCFLVSRGNETASLVVGNYGQMGEVIEGAKARRVKVKFPVASEPDLGEAQQLANNSGTQFMQANQASASLSISAHLLSRITGNIFVTPDQDLLTDNGSARKVNIALHLKYSSKNEQIPGYTRRDPNGSSWLYSMKTVELVCAYMEQFPDVIDYLCNHPSSDDMLASQLFPQAPERLNEITAWLKAQEYSQLAPQACGSEILEEDVVKVIERLVAESLNRNVPKYQRMQVKPHLLFTPELSNGIQPADPSTTFRLFDRVINCRKSYSVPLGLKGVVIGICKQSKDSVLYDIVFDEPFPGGLTLNCSEQRGYRVPGYSLINISHGQRMELGEQAQPKAYPTPSYMAPNSAFTPVPLHRPLVPNAMVFNTLGTTGPPPTHEITRSSGRQPFGNDKQSAWRTKQPFENGPGGQRNNSPAQKKEEVFSILSRPQRSGKESSSSPNGVPRNIAQTTDYKALWVGLDNKKQLSTQPEPKDASTALRQMLRIDGETPSEQQGQPMMLQQIFKQFTNQPATATNVKATETKSACGQLLSLFQARNLGTPRYSYVEDYSAHTFQATVKLPDGRAFTGQAGASKEKASEMAALKALDILRKEPSFVPPTPPPQWCAPTPTLPTKMSQVTFSNDNKSSQVLQSALPTNKTSSNQLTPAKNLVKQAQTAPFMPQFAQPAQQATSQSSLMPQFGQPAQQTTSQSSLMPQFGKPVQQTMSQAPLMPQFGQPTQHTSSQAPMMSLFGQPTQQTMSQASMMPQFGQSPQQTTPFTHPAMQVMPQAPLMPQFSQPQQQVAQFAHTAQQAPTLSSPMPLFAQAQKTIVHQQQTPFVQQQTTIQPPSRLNQNTLIQQQVPTQMAFMSQNIPTSTSGPMVFQRSQPQGPYVQQPAFVTFPHTQMQHMQQMFPTNNPPRMFPGPQHGFPVQAINPKPFSQLQVRMQQSQSVIAQQATPQRNQQTNGNWRGSEASQPQMAFVPLQAVKQQRKEASPPKQALPKPEQLSEVQPIPPVTKPITVPSSEKVIDGSPVPVIVVSRKICANFPGVKKKKK